MQTAISSGARLAGVALAWLIGTGVQLHQAQLWPEPWAWVAALAGGLALGLAWWRPRFWWCAVLGALACGFGGADGRAALRLAQVVPEQVIGRDVSVQGVIASLPTRTEDGWRFRFDVESAALNGRSVQLPPRLSLGWYLPWGRRAGAHSGGDPVAVEPTPRVGERWAFTLRLREPSGSLNPHGFDHELALFEQGVRGTGYVRDRPPPRRVNDATGHPVERAREQVRDAIQSRLGTGSAAALLTALTIGDQSGLSRADRELYRDTGIAHLVAISGLHVTMFAWLAGAVIGRLWRLSGPGLLRWPVPPVASVGGLVCAFGYALFAGWEVPAQRTVCMLATLTLARVMGRTWPWYGVLLAAAVVVSALDPWALLQPGFWLSFVAVGLLMSTGQPDAAPVSGPTTETEPVRRPAWLQASVAFARRLQAMALDGLRTQVIVTVGLAPLTLVLFGQVSVIGFAANLLAIPWVTLVITPLAMLGMAWGPLWLPAALAVEGLRHVLVWARGVPGAVWTLGAAPTWAQAAALVGAWLWVLPLPWRVRALATPLVLALALPRYAPPPPGAFELLAPDVGQGTAVLIRTRHRVLLYDTGPRYSRRADAGERVLLPLLRAHGHARIDQMVLSHGDLDHIGGASSLLAAMPVDKLMGSVRTDHPQLPPGQVVERCTAGQAWTWDGVHFEVLAPSAGRQGDSNAESCVLRVASAHGSVLLTGDIGRPQELDLIDTWGASLRSDVLMVPHHGSKTSSSVEFLAAVQPRWAVVQAGHRNRFGHPVPRVMDRYHARGIAVLSSPLCGAWRWPSERVVGPADQRSADAACERVRQRRYWHRQS